MHMISISLQISYLFLLAIPVACIAWTVTHEEIFSEPRDYCVARSKKSSSVITRKFFYLFTCEYCFSHYISLFFVIFTGFHMLYDNWVGYVISFFSLVWIANFYMSIYGFIRVGMKSEKMEADIKEEQFKECKENKAEAVELP